MLKKMGYEAGRGLGRVGVSCDVCDCMTALTDVKLVFIIGSKGQGLVKPVEAKLRKGKGAIGLYGREGPDRPQKSKQ